MLTVWGVEEAVQFNPAIPTDFYSFLQSSLKCEKPGNMDEVSACPLLPPISSPLTPLFLGNWSYLGWGKEHAWHPTPPQHGGHHYRDPCSTVWPLWPQKTGLTNCSSICINSICGDSVACPLFLEQQDSVRAQPGPVILPYTAHKVLQSLHSTAHSPD